MSLREIMLPFDPTFFMSLSNITGIYYKSFAKAFDGDKWSAEKVMDSDDKELFDQIYADVQVNCENMQLSASLATVKKMRACLKRSTSTYGEFFAFGPELNGRLMDEMQGRAFISMNSLEAKHFNEPREKWSDIVERFPDAETDIIEARRCFALGRYAASVFHCLQISEIGLIELGTFLGVTDPISGWSAVVGALQKVLATKYQDLEPWQRQNRDFLEQVNGTAAALKNAWRNKISHAHGRLTFMGNSDVAPDLAEEVLLATRSFMRRLAAGLPARTSEH